MSIIAEAAARPYANQDIARYIGAAEKLWSQGIPELECVRAMMVDHHLPGVLVTNLPHDLEVPPTGPAGRQMKKTSVSEAVAIALVHPLGRLAACADKRNGDLVSDLYPKTSDSTAQLGTGSVFLEWHTDEAFHDVPPSFVCLYGVRGEPQAQTLIADFDCSELPAPIASILSQPLFRIRADASHEAMGQIKHTSVLSGDGKDWMVRYDPVFIEFDNEEACQAFVSFEEFVLRRWQSFTIDTGQALIFNNKIGVHARTEFPARFDGTDRWLAKSQVVPRNTPEEKFQNVNPFLLNPNSVSV
jgi:hypothetical protein